MLASAFSAISEPRLKALVNIPAFNVWRFKHGGTKGDAIADGSQTCRTLIALADEHGSDLRIWGAGRAFDRIIQSSMKTRAGWTQATCDQAITRPCPESGVVWASARRAIGRPCVRERAVGATASASLPCPTRPPRTELSFGAAASW